MIKFVKGDMLRVKVDGLLYTSEGFATGNPGLCDGLLVFEFIDLVTFPSFNDFFGNCAIIQCIIHIVAVTGFSGAVMDFSIDQDILFILNFVIIDPDKCPKT